MTIAKANEKNELPSVLPVYQPIGFSTHQISKKISDLYHVKTSHTGTLDPLAEGVIIVLTGEERLKKIEYAGWKKTYEFEIAFGITTDSFDGMGLITDNRLNHGNKATFDMEQLSKVISKFKGHYEQEVPIYSAIKHQGKKLFHHAKAGNHIEQLPIKKGEIYEIELLGLYEKDLRESVREVLTKLENIVGDFRQDEIIMKWKEYLKELDKYDEHKKSTDHLPDIRIAKIRVKISRGMYVRSLSQDIAKQVGTNGFTFSILRTQNGIYTTADCHTLEDLFGKNFDRGQFVSKFNHRNFVIN